MLRFQSAIANLASDALVQTLGGAAALALLFTIGAIGAIFVRDHQRRKSYSRLAAAMRSSVLVAPPTVDETREEEIRRLRIELARLREDILKAGAPLLRDMAALADDALSAIAARYGELGRDSRAAPEPRAAHCRAVCESQWTSFRSELAYMSFAELQTHLRHVLDNCRIGGSGSSNAADADLDASPDALRAQEIASLAQGIVRQKVMAFQESMLEGVKPLRDHYEAHVKAWINDRIFRLVHRLGDRSQKGMLIRETGMQEQLMELKNQLEIAARLSERVSMNLQAIGQADLAFSQVIFAGMLLSILSRVGEWMPDLPGAPPPEPEEEEEDAGDDDPQPESAAASRARG